MIGIHKGRGFSERWIAYCEQKGIPFKLADCYDNDIVSALSDCDSLMWHYHQGIPEDNVIAKQILEAFQSSGKKVFPDHCTSWHFDDKVGQKYLLEALGLPIARSWVFTNKKKALEWAGTCSYPKVFKLRSGAGSQNVRLVRSRIEAFRLVKKAFGKGFPSYNAMESLRERWRKYRLGNTGLKDVSEGIARLVYRPKYSRYSCRERGYIYFQEFIPGNDHDIRVIVIAGKAFAIRREVRRNDFRASGSGSISYERKLFDEETIRLSFTMASKLMSQCMAFDYVYSKDTPLVVEISFGFSPEGYDKCPGYWDSELKWHEGPFDPYGWMVELVLKD